MTPDQTDRYLVAHLADDWIVQSFQGYITYIAAAAQSGFRLEPIIGRNYREFLFWQQAGRCEMWYHREDIDALWRRVRARIKSDGSWLVRLRAGYTRLIIRRLQATAWITPLTVQSLSEAGLFALLHRLARLQRDVIGVAHLVEPISQRAGDELRDELTTIAKSPVEAIELALALETPTEPSFLAREEAELRAIKELPVAQRSMALQAHARRYGWLQNSYLGPTWLTADDFAQRLDQLDDRTGGSQAHDSNQLDELKRSVRLSPWLERLATGIQLTGAWQDERKANNLQVFARFGSVLNELARRIDVEPTIIAQLTWTELNNVRSLSKLTALAPRLEERLAGTWLLSRATTDTVVTGQRAIQLRAGLDRGESHTSSELAGTVASPGMATGRVVICHTTADIARVQPGDVLVAPMTRPEYLPAMKRAAAIVTDEGGITSHAAIVSRELGIPCIIGTHRATIELHNGDTVEVDGVVGIVRRVNR